MGIDGFHKWLKEKHPKTVKFKYSERKYDYIYVDVNHLLHNAMNGCTKEHQFVNNLHMALNWVFNSHLATKKIILAVDGPSPYSKVVLQRKRRLMGTKDTVVSEITPLSLTPGTKLMNRLTKYLIEYIEILKHKYHFLNVEIDFSPTTEPDEGEIKVFRKLLEYGGADPYASHLVVGNDADLVVLAMAAKPVVNINMLVRMVGEHCLIDINELIISIGKNVYPYDGNQPELFYNVYNFAESGIRDDFSLLSLMMGNDYLPKIQAVKFESLWTAYYETKKLRDDFMIKDGQFNREFLVEFLVTLLPLLAKQYSKFKYSKYSEDNTCNYLEGLLWCLNMYNTTECSMYDYMYHGQKGVSVSDIVFYLNSNSDEIEIPESETEPLDSEVCALLLMPKKARKLVPDKYQDYIDDELAHYYEEEECDECFVLRDELSVQHKKMHQERKKLLDTTDTRKEIGNISRKLTKHRKMHSYSFSTRDIKKILTLVQH